MKITDFAPRTAPFDHHLIRSGKQDLAGIEIGVDVGAHAESLLLHCPVRKLHLVDIWDKEYYRGYCEGRLLTKGYGPQVHFMKMDSMTAASQFQSESFDFIYIDQLHEYEVVKADMEAWWPKLKPLGILGYRNYSHSANPGLRRAIDEFIEGLPPFTASTHYEQGEIILIKK